MNKTSLPAGEKFNKKDFLNIDKIISEEYNNDNENLIMILQAIQKKYNYIPKPILTYVSEKMKIPFSQMYGITTFYSTFSLIPRGKNIISVCLGTACHVRGADRVTKRIKNTLNILDSETTKDKQFTLESVRCIGCCSLGPVIKINEDFHGKISSDKVKKILSKYK